MVLAPSPVAWELCTPGITDILLPEPGFDPVPVLGDLANNTDFRLASGVSLLLLLLEKCDDSRGGGCTGFAFVVLVEAAKDLVLSPCWPKMLLSIVSVELRVDESLSEAFDLRLGRRF
jgi:hypothetical protein